MNRIYVDNCVLQILLAALPGMLIATALTACVCYTFFARYSWSFMEACFFGCIISATDPVAVVAILKEVGMMYPVNYNAILN